MLGHVLFKFLAWAVHESSEPCLRACAYELCLCLRARLLVVWGLSAPASWVPVRALPASWVPVWALPASCACARELVCLWFEVWVHLRAGFRALFSIVWLHSECTCELGLGHFFHCVAAFWVHLRAGFRAFFPCVAAFRGACEWVHGVFSIVWLHNIWLLNIWRLLRSWGAIWKLVIAKKLLQRGYLEEWCFLLIDLHICVYSGPSGL